MLTTAPLLFTSELHEVAYLQVVLPTGDRDFVSHGDTDADVVLPTGFTAVSLDIVELDFYRRNISLTLSIANTSLLDGGEIICREWRNFKVVIAGCPISSRL